MTKVKAKFNQAEKVVARFGGYSKLAALLGVSRQTVYRWLQPRPIGTEGLIPTSQTPAILELAKTHGVDLADVDWAPEDTSQIEELLS